MTTIDCIYWAGHCVKCLYVASHFSLHTKSLQLCPALCNSSPLGSSVHEIFQTRILELFLHGCHALLQGIFPTQGLNLYLLGLLHWLVGSLSLAPPGKPFFCSRVSRSQCTKKPGRFVKSADFCSSVLEVSFGVSTGLYIFNECLR